MKKINYSVEVFTNYGPEEISMAFNGANADTAWGQVTSHKDVHAMATDGYMYFIPYETISRAFRDVSSETVTAPEDAFCE